MRDLPRPASPETSTTWPSPALTRAQRRSSSSISSSRPISGLSADPCNASNRLATALGRSTCQTGTGPPPLPSRHGSADAFHLDGAEIAVVEEIADQPARARGDDDHARLGQGLQSGCEGGRLAHDRVLLRPT